MPSTIAFDSETYPISRRLQAPPIVCFQWADGPRPEDAHITTDTDRALSLFSEWLSDPSVDLVAHNTAFDLGVLLAEAGGDPSLFEAVFGALEAGRVHDTMYRERLIQLGVKGYSGYFVGLDKLVDKYLCIDISDDKHNEFSWRAHYHYLDGVPVGDWPQAAVEYAKNDPRYTLEVYRAQATEKQAPDGSDVAGPDYVVDEGPTVGMAFNLRLMSIWGMRLNESLGEQRAEEIDADFDALADDLVQVGLYSRNGDDYKRNMSAIRERVEQAYKANGQDVPTTDNDNVKTDRQTLNESGDEALAMVGELSAIDKLRSTYKPIITQDATVHPGYDALKNTGRSSSFSPNIQNIPRGGDIRQCFESRPGTAFCLCDYSTLELATWAQVCLDMFGQSRLAEALRDGLDPHSYYAAEMRGIPYDRQKAEEAGEYGDKKAKKANDARQFAKVPNYGVPGGLTSPYSLQDYAKGYGLDLTVAEARDAFDFFYKVWPEVELYFSQLQQMTGFEDSATLHFHRSERLRADTRFTAMANGRFQGLAADGGRLAVHRLQRACYANTDHVLYGSRPVAYVHDETITEVPFDRMTEAAEAISDIMESAMQEYTPDIPIEAEPALALRWFKGADPVFDEDGNLEIWIPHKRDDNGQFKAFDPDEYEYARRRLGRDIQYGG